MQSGTAPFCLYQEVTHRSRGDTFLLSETRYEHIKLNENRVPIITGTTTKVIELITDHLAYNRQLKCLVKRANILRKNPTKHHISHLKTNS